MKAAPHRAGAACSILVDELTGIYAEMEIISDIQTEWRSPMFFNRTPKKTNRAQCLIEQYQRAVKKDAQNRCYYFPLLYSALFCSPAPRHIRYISYEAKELIQGKDAFFVVSLMHSYYADIADADADAWKRAGTPAGYRALLICGSAHPNGYFREYCLKRLANERDVLPFILLRMNDWVPEIRLTAMKLLPEQLMRIESCAELIQTMPMVEYVRRGQRVQRNTEFTMDELDAALMRKFAAEPDAVLRSPLSLRRLCYRVFLLHPDAGYSNLMLHFIRNEHDGAQRSGLVRAYLKNKQNPASAELLEEFMQDKYWRIRLDAYEYRMKQQGSWAGLEALLHSPYCSIREFAAYYLEKNGFDNIRYCREHLPETLLALGDLGSEEDIPYIRPFLKSHSCEALVSLVRLNAEDSKEFVLQAMYDSHPKFAKTAYRLAEKRLFFTRSELMPRIESETDPQRRWRLIRLLGRNVGADLLPVLIRLMRDYSQLRTDIQAKIEEISCFHAFGYHALIVSPALYDETMAALDYAEGIIPRKLLCHLNETVRIRKH